MDDDGWAVERAAQEAIDQHGDDAVAILRERADLADQIGDMLTAETWRDIADAAERILRS
jgi:hypothetical protein